MILTNKYIYISNYLELGKFYAHHAPHPFTLGLIPVFKVNHVSDFKVVLIPGKLNTNTNTFFQCPLDVFYTRINGITQEETRKNSSNFYTISIDFELLNKEKSTLIAKKITLSDYSILNFMTFNELINYLNIYVDKDYNIELLELSNIHKYFFTSHKKEDFIDAIWNLELSFYENSNNIWRPGKDNHAWTEIEFKNLPQNTFIRNCIINSLKKQGEVVLQEYGFMVILKDFYTCPDNIQRSHFVDEKKKLFVMSKLLFDFGAMFDSEEMILFNLQKI